MSESVLGELRTDFVERNTSLFLLLGILSAGGRLTRTLALTEPVPPVPPTKLDYFTLGLIAIAGRFNAFAQHAAENAPEQGDGEDRRPEPMDLLR